MLKKIDLAQQFLMQHLGLFCCPICQESMVVKGYALVCSKVHQFDLAKKGTIHFLQRQIKSNYTKQLFTSRRQMIMSGMYQPLITAINQQLTGDVLLDVGCGEGSFLASLDFSDVRCGFDIAKEGIALASDYTDSSTFFCVADLTHLPFGNQSISTVLNLFTPSNYQEFQRILKPNGRIIKVVPEADYLKELRAAYQQRVDYSNNSVLDKFHANFHLELSERISYQFAIPKDLRQLPLEMSPLEWQVSKALKQKVRQAPPHALTIDVRLLVGSLKTP
ncbi:MAG: methyltransferase domain-containing protein [Streptococcaceae bacterium]|jgi:23S rRNA (guanine745-N1)-methyltransferase|nr:methyltransferase domain-containing protein [Streptococcaceae bacterium]